MPVGILLRRRKLMKSGKLADEVPAFPRLDFNDAHVRRATFVVVGLTVVNAILLATSSAAALSFMDTPKFCGTVCHKVMQPEYTAYQNSPHSRVKCVQCHIGPGASFMVRSKFDGLRQVWKVLTGTYAHPIASPVHTLRPARDTCEGCHWPAKHYGDKLRSSAGSRKTKRTPPASPRSCSRPAVARPTRANSTAASTGGTSTPTTRFATLPPTSVARRSPGSS
jgi:nitrate/TMAO reductase-like tetraheme cytochrome c subunit